MASAIQALEKEKTAYQTNMKNYDTRLAEYKTLLETLDRESKRRGEVCDEQKDQLRVLQLAQKDEIAKAAQAALREQGLHTQVVELQQAEKQRLEHEEAALIRYQANDLVRHLDWVFIYIYRS